MAGLTSEQQVDQALIGIGDNEKSQITNYISNLKSTLNDSLISLEKCKIDNG